MQVLTAPEARVVRALGQAIFPREAKGLPDGFDAGVVAYIDELLALAQPYERTQLRGMFQLFDRGYAAWAGRPLARLDAATQSEAGDYLKSWEKSGTYTRRMVFEALRSVYLMAYFGGDRVNAEVGVHAAPDVDAPMAFLSRVAGGIDAVDAVQQAKEEPAAVRADSFLGRPDGLFEFSDYRGDIREVCDYLVVGSGPGGAILAWQLAQTGKKVILVEAGPVARREDLGRDGGKTMTRLLWDSGMRTTRGNFIGPTMQAKVLGGGSIVNSAICLRASGSALDAWAHENGLTGHSLADLTPHYEAVERFMGVRPTEPAMQGPRNDLFAKGAAAIGLNPLPIARNESGCLGSGGCMYGCRNGAKLSHDRRGVPELLAAGGRVYTSVQADRLLMNGTRVAGIEGHISEPYTGRKTGSVRIVAKCTVIAAGVIATPVLLQKSGLRSPGIGANLRMHPGTVVAGDFDEPIYPWYGASQGMHVLDMLPYGIKLETLWVDPALMAFRMPAMGSQLKRQLQRYKNQATWDAWVSGDDSVGAVRYVPGVPRPQITYDLGLGDMRRLQHATATLAEMLFAAGATKVYPGIHGLPQTLRRADEVPALRMAQLAVTDIPSGSNHVFGTMAMGADSKRHPTDSFGAVRGVDDLYVCDASLFPGSPGANPMLTIWALAHRMGGTLAERYA